MTSRENWTVGKAAIAPNSNSLEVSVQFNENGYVFLDTGSGNRFQIYSPYQAMQLAKLLWRAGRAAVVAKHQTEVAKAATVRAYETRDRIVQREASR